MRTDTLDYGPMARYKRLINARNRKVKEGIPLFFWKDGHELKNNKKSQFCELAFKSF